MSNASPRNDPYRGFNFLLEIDGVIKAGFSEVGELSTETDVIDYREGSERTTVRKLPGLTRYSNIVLKRGVTKDKSLWQWRKAVIDGNVQRANGSITLLDENRQPVLVWNFREGWPCKWEGPALNAKTSDVAIEMIEIAHEGLELV